MTITPAVSAATDEEELRKFPFWRRNLRVVPLANLLCSLGFSVSWPFLPLMVRSLGVQEHLETWMGYMMLVFYVIGFTFAPIWGGLADHYGRKLMVLRAMLGMGFFMTLIPFAPSPMWFAGLLMLVGFFNGFNPAGMSLLVANTPRRHIGRVLSLAQTGALVGQTMGPALGSLLAAFIDKQHWVFWISGGLLLSGGTLVAVFAREVKHLAPGPWRPQWFSNLGELLAVPGIGPLFFLSLIFSVLANANVTIMTIYVLQLLAAQPEGAGSEAFWAGCVAMGLSVSSVIALPLWSRVVDRFNPARVLAVVTGIAALAHVPLLFLDTPLQLVMTRVAFGLGASVMVPVVVRLLKEYAPPGMDARAISYSSSFQLMAMGVAPFCAGLIGPALGLRTYFALTVVLTLAGLVLWLRKGRQ